MSEANEICRILDLNKWADLIVGVNGYAAKRRPDIAPFAYEILVNKPLREQIVEKVVEFAGGADVNLARSLFGLCNGIRVGATKFGVYGVLGQIDRTSSDLAFHPPLDINIPNIYGRPEGWPEQYLIVGFSEEVFEASVNQKMIHAITPQGTILIAPKDDSSAVCREYSSIESWLSSEVQRAIDDVMRF